MRLIFNKKITEKWSLRDLCVHCSLLKSQNMHLGKKRRRKETQTWIRKCESKRILRVHLNKTYFVKTENWKSYPKNKVFMGLFRYCLLLKIKNIVVK